MTAHRVSSSFSPITPESDSMAAATVAPSASGSACSASTSAGRASAAAATTWSARAWKSAFFATKSVSQFSSIIAPPSAATRPLWAERSAPRLAALAAPEMRRISTAFSKSPSASSSAFLHSIIPAAGEVAELLDVLGGDVPHGVSGPSSWVGGRAGGQALGGRAASGLLGGRGGGDVGGLGGRFRHDGVGGDLGGGVGRRGCVGRDGLDGRGSTARPRRHRPRRRRPRRHRPRRRRSRRHRPRPRRAPQARPRRSRRAARSPTRPAARRRRRCRQSPHPARAISPSATASAMTRVSRATERMASSLPGIGKSTSSGSQLVSRIATIGMLSLRASATAMCSFLVSTIHTALGTRAMSRMPPRVRSSFSFSRCAHRAAPSSSSRSPRRRRSRSPRAP